MNSNSNMEENANGSNLPDTSADYGSDMMVNINAPMMELEIAADNAPEPMELDTEDATGVETPLNFEISVVAKAAKQAEKLVKLTEALCCPDGELKLFIEAELPQDELMPFVKTALRKLELEIELLEIKAFELWRIRKGNEVYVKRVKELKENLELLYNCYQNRLGNHPVDETPIAANPSPPVDGAATVAVEWEQDPFEDAASDPITDEEDGEGTKDDEETDEAEEFEDDEETDEAEEFEDDEEIDSDENPKEE